MYAIIWSPIAKTSYIEILKFLEENWTSKEIEYFISRTERLVKLISQNPNLFQYSINSDTFRCLVVPHVSLFYRLKNENIELLVFWDNRKDPKKLII
ncbi:type II toxin-antitoxin system RelE/ParE family toxin [Pedobacter jejuensis]|uniref:Type II toxin-antitoxin system RelE/ParE family toxin n=1 Tax=Pedobacter jejuensis TaxID=1268550 RepID=A0A3N0BPS8_9SPHI|nr:type II toxin-antitoxin system RelE/ParE family toxin [Pedobacter jejuensis]